MVYNPAEAAEGPPAPTHEVGVGVVSSEIGSYAGERRAGKAEGVGVYADARGQYAGEYRGNQREGFGVYTFTGRSCHADHEHAVDHRPCWDHGPYHRRSAVLMTTGRSCLSTA